ncbi:carbohydrate ABC transporter permease [Peloplasma aerotolerans]|jgi:oligogalacturonide transport system permease protein|uniref:Sugar ABC transporter permease n=1 Tax=Peloplasma aerotolerans TaxID=3044389 RepID=A0AAW6UAK2_9MOLU|nr:sugar ABC transporter permease [Mariniplasma sp. M4Ah]MDI6453131.1 sugar ABC transporter permease [Mariniplasma sp. M4Ah]MDR4968546.1 sugar ABC transporter permease [Acholeplasmataceae bacterium]
MVGEKKWVPYVLLGPWIIGFILFKLYPFINSFIMSLFRTQGRNSVFVGFDNFVQIFNTVDPIGEEFVQSLGTTFIYVFVTVPLILIVSLFVAYVLALKLRGIGFFRTAFYIPTVLGTNVAIILLWRFIFQDEGLINQIIGLFGLGPVQWLGTSAGAMTSIITLRVWQFGSTMLIFLNALKNVPESLYEAATIDGAGKFRQFFAITLPMITPIILFNAVMRLVETFQIFNGPYLITQGGPARSTNVINLLIYNVAFYQGNLNLGAAMSWVLFLIIMVFTVLIFRSSRYWVHYQD